MCECVDLAFQLCSIDCRGIEACRSRFQCFGMARVSSVGEGGQECVIAFRPADILRRAAAGGLQQERHADGIGILEPALELDDVLPVVAEVIQVADGFRPGFPNDVVEPDLSGIDQLIARGKVRFGVAPLDAAGGEGVEMVLVQPNAACKVRCSRSRRIVSGTTSRRITSGSTRSSVTFRRTAVRVMLMPRIAPAPRRRRY